jgi:DNA-nicking Smr family endonuclease
VDFGDILNNWENEKKNSRSAAPKQKQEEEREHIMDSLLDHYAPDSLVIGSKEEKKPYIPNVSREKMRRKKADLVLDLHGLSAEDAKIELNNFIQKSFRTGARKILIIHGKGNHTNGQAVLKPLVKSVLEISPYIGDIGTPERRDGGSGATWAVVRQRSL